MRHIIPDPSPIPDAVADLKARQYPAHVRDAILADANARRVFALCRSPWTAEARENAIADANARREDPRHRPAADRRCRMSETPQKTPPRIVMDVTRDGWTNGIQLGISALDENGSGLGYRIAGPKYNGSQSLLLTTDLDERDAREIREHLDKAFPSQAEAGLHAEAERLRAELAARPTRAEVLREAADKLSMDWGGPEHDDGMEEARGQLRRMADAAERGHCCHLHRPDGCCDPEDCGPCCERCTACPTLARADVDPTRLRWGLDDVEYGDDDSATVLLSGPRGESFVLELDADRATALRDALNGPEEDE